MSECVALQCSVQLKMALVSLLLLLLPRTTANRTGTSPTTSEAGGRSELNGVGVHNVGVNNEGMGYRVLI